MSEYSNCPTCRALHENGFVATAGESLSEMAVRLMNTSKCGIAPERAREVVFEGYAPADMLVYPDDYSLTDLSDIQRPDYVPVIVLLSGREAIK